MQITFKDDPRISIPFSFNLIKWVCSHHHTQKLIKP